MAEDVSAQITPTKALRVCEKDHGASWNSATVYGHHGSVRICLRIFGIDKWVYDPRWEEPQ